MIEGTITVSNHSYTVQYPDECPICHHHGEIPVRATFELPRSKGVQVVFQCPFAECRSYFIGYYGPRNEPTLKALKPQTSSPPELPAFVTELSPTFSAIYTEAEEARHAGLSQICGPGYRKAFEFLVKDYAKSLKPEKKEEIEKSFSGNVIAEFIKDPRIQAVAKRALWLGNDETHYLKRWSSHDVDDLVTLIKLTINWMEIERLSAQYINEMPG